MVNSILYISIICITVGKTTGTQSTGEQSTGEQSTTSSRSATGTQSTGEQSTGQQSTTSSRSATGTQSTGEQSTTSSRSAAGTQSIGQQPTTSSRSAAGTQSIGEQSTGQQSTAASPELTATTTSSTEETARTSRAERITIDTIHEEQSDSVDRKSHVWEYFERCQDSEVLKAKCFLCGDELRTPNYATSSLIRHLEQRHNLQQAAQTQVLPVRTKSNKLSRAERKRLDSLAIVAIIQDGRSYGDLHKSGMKKLIDGLQPGYTPPHRNMVTKHLKRLHKQYADRTKNEFEKVKYLSLTCDFWKDRKQNSYLVITGHYIDEKFDQFSKVLQFMTFEDRHYSPIIAYEIEKQLINFNLFNKLVTITCDGASNMRDMFTYFSRSNIQYVRCIAHKLHLIICNGLNLWVTTKTKQATANNEEINNNVTTEDEEEGQEIGLSQMVKSMSFDVDHISNDEINENGTSSKDDVDDVEDMDDYDDDDGTDCDSQPVDISDDVVSDNEWSDEEDDEDITDNFIEGVEMGEISLDQLPKMVKDLMDKVREIITMIKSSSVFSGFIDKKRIMFNAHVSKKQKINRRLINDVRTRWNSTFKMLCAFNIYRDFINDLFKAKGNLGLTRKQKLRFTRLELTIDEWDILRSLIDLLHPFYSSTKVLSNTKYPTIGSALYLLKSLEEYLSKEDDNQFFNALRKLLMVKFQHYIIHDVEQFDMLKLYAYFDPTGFSALTRLEQVTVEKEIIKLSKNEFALPKTSSSSTNQGTISKPTNIDKAWQGFLKSINKNVRQDASALIASITLDVEEDLKRYRSLASKFFFDDYNDHQFENPTVFWKIYGIDLPVLSEMARCYLSAPATSVQSESAFSISAHYGRKERSRLSPDNLAMSVFLKDKL
ncbi:unnamed protein product [Adineta ricciae]|uniref:BED-type domain-containing protein n=1 Tax=Adineta ricciae TaxID=249248 RepID=A0A815NV51_ADIRI|nr:unnamed protein product [Adineta ricciae]